MPTTTVKYLDDNGLTYYHSKIKTLLNGKVNTETGKGLSTNDFTTAEKNKLSGIATGAEVNQNAFSNVKVGATTVAADSKTDTLELIAGTNVTLTPDATNDTVTIAATDTTYSDATTSASGLMSASDKTKLNGIASGAEVNVQSDWSQATTTADDYIKNKPTKVSDFTNDSNFQTQSQVQQAINDAIGQITGLSFEIVQTLPATGTAGTIYLVPNSGSAPNIYDEYVWITSSGTGSFEKIGTTDVDLTGYVQFSNLVAITNAEIDTIVA